MTKVVLSNKFKRAVRKFTRRDAQLQAKIEVTIAQISEDLANPALGTHKLEGKLSGLLACSCGYDCRIVFAIETEEDSGETVIVLLNVGTHDEVY
jgi:mRNA interferase YafQ